MADKWCTYSYISTLNRESVSDSMIWVRTLIANTTAGKGNFKKLLNRAFMTQVARVLLCAYECTGMCVSLQSMHVVRLSIHLQSPPPLSDVSTAISASLTKQSCFSTDQSSSQKQMTTTTPNVDPLITSYSSYLRGLYDIMSEPLLPTLDTPPTM